MLRSSSRWLCGVIRVITNGTGRRRITEFENMSRPMYKFFTAYPCQLESSRSPVSAGSRPVRSPPSELPSHRVLLATGYRLEYRPRGSQHPAPGRREGGDRIFQRSQTVGRFLNHTVLLCVGSSKRGGGRPKEGDGKRRGWLRARLLCSRGLQAITWSCRAPRPLWGSPSYWPEFGRYVHQRPGHMTGLVAVIWRERTTRADQLANCFSHAAVAFSPSLRVRVPL